MTDLEIKKLGDTLGKNIKTIMSERKITQKELAKRVDVSRATISNIVNGKGGTASFWTMMEIAKEIGTRIEELYKEV